MKEYVYHVVTERPMFAGQEMLFDSEHCNGVFRRVTQFERFMKNEPVDADLKELFESDSEKWKKVCLRELAMEKVRKEKFPHLPSRLACLYTSRTLAEAQSWAQFFKDCGRNVFSIVLLCVDGNTFDADACGCFDGTNDTRENERKALAYWQTKCSVEPPVIETLADGKITVIEIIENYKPE